MPQGQEPPATDDLIRRAAAGDPVARDRLLSVHRGRLKRMVAARLDRRLSSRVDPSDVVQETLGKAARELDDYLARPPLPFYPWLRRIAWERLVDLHRRHMRADRRSVVREHSAGWPLPDHSALALIDRIADRGTSPSRRLVREEDRRRIRGALDDLPDRDREVLVMRYLEQLSGAEIAAVLGIGEGAVKMRLLRALERLRALLDDPDEEVRR